MMLELFNKKRTILVEKATILKLKDEINIWSYNALIRLLLETTPENIEFKKKALIHFILDSYCGDSSLESEVIRFLNTANWR